MPLFFNPAGVKWGGRGPEKIMGKLWEMFSILWNDIQGAHKAATDLYILHLVPRRIPEDTGRNSMNQLYFDNDFHILPSKFCTHRYLRRKNTCRFIHIQPWVNYGKIESYTSLLAKGPNDEMSVRLSVIGWWTDGGMSLTTTWWSNKWDNLSLESLWRGPGSLVSS